ncbi:hypothetical protein BU16DRAFT_619532 [Lophium mytilinum]|uniref:Uncharacterized protein n=1 Tax=Lophium mytilinum TaxID=390894 RepID=A0A6A6QLE2_9PEZI|nr:hypothetical protein BU16DRAFT_619532 [Lophium mytilinum]
MSSSSPPSPLPTLFITGALGYIGGTFLTVLKRSQPSILTRALVRDQTQAETLSDFYGWTVTPIIGKLDDLEFLTDEAAKADIIIQATGDNTDAVLALMEGTTLNPKHNSANTIERPIFIQISGASNVAHTVLGEKSPRVWSDIADWDDLLKLEETRISVKTDNAIRKLSSKKNIRSLTLSPNVLLGRGLGAGKTETFPKLQYENVLKNGAAFLGGKGTNVWSSMSIEDLGRACVFLLEEAQKGNKSRLQFGQNGYYFITAFDLSAADRAQALGERLYKQGLIPTPEVQVKTLEEIGAQFGPFGPVLAASSSLIRADKLGKLGWKPVDYDWVRLVQEAPGTRC